LRCAALRCGALLASRRLTHRATSGDLFHQLYRLHTQGVCQRDDVEQTEIALAALDSCCAAACAIVDGLAALPGVEILWRPRINQGLVRFPSPVPGACDYDHDQCTDRIIQRILAHGDAFFMGTTWHGRRAMRVSVLNWQTGREDIEVAIRSVAKAIAEDQAV
jgi:glutamate/tyrosine decarboxylase-like PLP-dependent enzyme